MSVIRQEEPERLVYFLFVSKALAKYTARSLPVSLFIEHWHNLKFQFQREMSKSTALQTFSLTNNILEVPPQDEIYRFDADANRKFNQEMPWTKE